VFIKHPEFNPQHPLKKKKKNLGSILRTHPSRKGKDPFGGSKK
jgi:hypothetical protein